MNNICQIVHPECLVLSCCSIKCDEAKYIINKRWRDRDGIKLVEIVSELNETDRCLICNNDKFQRYLQPEFIGILSPDTKQTIVILSCPFCYTTYSFSFIKEEDRFILINFMKMDDRFKGEELGIIESLNKLKEEILQK